MNNGVHGSAERPGTSSPVDRIPSTYFPFPLPGAGGDGPFFPPTAEAFMQAAAAAAAAAAVGRQVPGAGPPSLGVGSAAQDAAREEPGRRGGGAGSCSPGVRANPADTDDDDAVSALSCAESECTASPGPSPGPLSPAGLSPAGLSPGGTADLVDEPSSHHRPAAGDVEMIAS